MIPGTPLTPEEAKHVEDTVLRLASKEGLVMSSPNFIRELKWPQRRLPDVRGHLERRAVGLRVMAQIGLEPEPGAVYIILMSRNLLTVRGRRTPKERP